MTWNSLLADAVFLGIHYLNAVYKNFDFLTEIAFKFLIQLFLELGIYFFPENAIIKRVALFFQLSGE